MDNNELLSTLPPPPALWRLTVVQVTGIVYFAFRKTRSVVGSMEECEALYMKVRTHNLLCGWWGIFALFWNAGALEKNRAAMQRLRDLDAAGKRAPDWHDDPTGRHTERYWDGERWTEQVRDHTSDPARDPIASAQ
jgi:hypothetical protein